jgi:hypothetical protein
MFRYRKAYSLKMLVIRDRPHMSDGDGQWTPLSTRWREAAYIPPRILALFYR